MDPFLTKKGMDMNHRTFVYNVELAPDGWIPVCGELEGEWVEPEDMAWDGEEEAFH